MVYVWLIAMIAFLAIEAATVSLVSIWFVGGALAAMILAALGCHIFVQVLVFLVVSIVLLIVVLPYCRKKQKVSQVATNADRILNMRGIVTEKIDPIEGTGAIKVDGKEWSARTDDDSVLEKDVLVRILRIDGVKAIVKKIDKD